MDLKAKLKPTRNKIIITVVIFIAFQIIFNYSPFLRIVESNAMSPVINKGDMILITSVDFQDVEVGDIVVFLPEGVPVSLAHRVVGIDAEAGHFGTKGDANSDQLTIEQSVPSDRIQGKVISTIPLIGYPDLLHVGWIIRLIIIYLILSLLIPERAEELHSK